MVAVRAADEAADVDRAERPDPDPRRRPAVARKLDLERERIVTRRGFREHFAADSVSRDIEAADGLPWLQSRELPPRARAEVKEPEVLMPKSSDVSGFSPYKGSLVGNGSATWESE